MTGVTILGGLTMASIAGYFVAFARALSAPKTPWGELFAQNVLWFLYVPFTLGLVYFFARVQLGRSLLAQGALEEAITWTSSRQRYNFWMRGKREVLIQRVVLAQAHLRRCDFEQARRVLWDDEPLPARARELLELHVWRYTWALRHEDLVLAGKVRQEADALHKPAEQRAALLALDAMKCLRAKKDDEVRRALDESEWLAITWQARLVRALWVSENLSDLEMREHVFETWQETRQAIATFLPGALPEYLVAMSKLMAHKEEQEQASSLIEEARALVQRSVADPRSQWVMQQQMERPGELAREEE